MEGWKGFSFCILPPSLSAERDGGNRQRKWGSPPCVCSRKRCSPIRVRRQAKPCKMSFPRCHRNTAGGARPDSGSRREARQFHTIGHIGELHIEPEARPQPEKRRKAYVTRSATPLVGAFRADIIRPCGFAPCRREKGGSSKPRKIKEKFTQNLRKARLTVLLYFIFCRMKRKKLLQEDFLPGKIF